MQSWPGAGVGGVPGNGRGAAALIPLVPLGTNQGLGPLRPRLNDQGLCLGPDTGHVWGLRGLGSRESPCLSREHFCLFSWERLPRGKEGMGETCPMMKRKTKSAKQTNKQMHRKERERGVFPPPGKSPKTPAGCVPPTQSHAVWARSGAGSFVGLATGGRRRGDSRASLGSRHSPRACPRPWLRCTVGVPGF